MCKKIENKYQLEGNDTTVPFTARLIAYYRAQESKKDRPLIIDPLAEQLAGNLESYFKTEESFRINDYPIIRSYYVEKYLLTPWCESRKQSQIVMLGAGLDTRAYRFIPLKTNMHILYEIDFPSINHYKTEILKELKSFCLLKRVSKDISTSKWIPSIISRGFSNELPTFWILEGFVFYLEKDKIRTLLKEIAEISGDSSQIFVDIGLPILAEVDFGPFFKHFKWGLNEQDIIDFFASTGWNVSYSSADEYDHGRFAGQGLWFFVNGVLKQ